ncbi:uncharacterized protein LOC130848854 [Hippopotamus amphibius kiboko]|uniref:uncharacterized protein LOC130848854 n=1 Tax=Hippopotamus amphibius kiboko TaxID=575201 RepID=UPI0025963D21|nr:uncharacterized protein LOC130848854 [Hippopotamus amphibius kiboko]
MQECSQEETGIWLYLECLTMAQMVPIYCRLIYLGRHLHALSSLHTPVALSILGGLFCSWPLLPSWDPLSRALPSTPGSSGRPCPGGQTSLPCAQLNRENSSGSQISSLNQGCRPTQPGERPALQGLPKAMGLLQRARERLCFTDFELIVPEGEECVFIMEGEMETWGFGSSRPGLPCSPGPPSQQCRACTYPSCTAGVGAQSLIHQAFSESLPHARHGSKNQGYGRGRKRNKILNQRGVREELDQRERKKLYNVLEVLSILRKNKADGEDRETWVGVSAKV